MATQSSDVAGLVLIGGQSNRMGRPKALVELAKRPLWRHAYDLLSRFTREVIVVGAVEGFGAPSGVRQIFDDPPGSGPLGGLVAGLEQSGYEHHLLIAVDYPFVQEPFLQRILDTKTPYLAVCGQSGEFLEPLVGYYHRDCVTAIRQMLAEGDYRAHGLHEHVPSHVIPPDEMLKIDPAKLSHFNVNTPSDLVEAQARFRSGFST